MDYIVKLEEVFFTYGGNFVLEDVNLSIEHGDFLAIFGPNGGGKTTLLKLILGLIKPTKGTISYNFKKKKVGQLVIFHRPTIGVISQ